MGFSEVIAMQKMELGAVAPVNKTENAKTAVAVLTDSDIPESMPLTNCLDKITVDQGAWAIQNGTSWIAYLKAHGEEVVEYPKAKDIEVSPVEQYQAICDTLENVWLVLTNNMARSTLQPEQVTEWVDTLQGALAVIPNGYERQHSMIQTELDDWQSRLP